MSLFKKKNTYKKGELRVELKDSHYTIFTDDFKKYICIHKDYENIIEFDCYEIYKNTLILKKDDAYAILGYIQNKLDSSQEYTFTGFIYNSIEFKDNVLVLNSFDNQLSLYVRYTLIPNIVGFEYNKDVKLFTVKYSDHQELYSCEAPPHKIKLIGYAKTFNILHTECFRYSDRCIVSYEKEDGSLSYFIYYSGYVELENNDFSCTSLKLVTVLKEHYFIASDNDYKYFVVNVFNPDITTAKKYDKITVVNNLFLCTYDSNVAIIDHEFNEIYNTKFEDVSKLTFSYNTNEDSYVLCNNGDNIISLKQYLPEYLQNSYFYSINNYRSNSSILYNKDNSFSKENFVKVINERFFEFKDCYLFYSSYYFILNKNCNIKDITYTEDVLKSQYLENILISIDNSGIPLQLEGNSISLLQKCNVKNIRDITSISKSHIEISAENSFAKLEIVGHSYQHKMKYNIKILLDSNFNITLSEDDLKTNLNDYLLTSIDDKFRLAFIKYYIK